MFSIILSILLFFSITEKSIESNVADYLNTHLTNYNSFEYKIIKIPKGYSSIKIIDNKAFKLKGSLAYIPVRITTKGRAAITYISVRVKLFKDVLVSKRTIKRRENLSQNDFNSVIKNVALLYGKPITDLKSINKFRSYINIKKGEILTRKKIEKIPLIKIGDKIKVNVIQQNVLIQTDATSMQEGGIGDVILVETAGNKKIKAKIYDSKNVIISE